MAAEEWTVNAKITGEFYIIDEHRASKAPLVEGLQQMSLSPNFDDDGKWTGLHELEAVLSLENKGSAPLESHVVYERAEKLVDSVTSLATLGIGRPVLVCGGVSVKRRLTDEPPKYRVIVKSMKQSYIAPPAPLPVELLTMSINPKIQRVIRWMARGLATSDAVDRLVALNNALDLLAGMVVGASTRIRYCKSCRAEETIGPGLRERVVYFLNCELGYTMEVAIDIYESRLDLAHARSNLEVNDIRRYRMHANLVAAAVRTGIARTLTVTLPPIPEQLPIDIFETLLDLEYVENTNGAGIAQ